MWDGRGDLVGIGDGAAEYLLSRDAERGVVDRSVEEGRVREAFDDYRESRGGSTIAISIAGRARLNIAGTVGSLRRASTTGSLVIPLALGLVLLGAGTRRRRVGAVVVALVLGCQDSVSEQRLAEVEVLDWQGSPLAVVGADGSSRVDMLPYGARPNANTLTMRGFVGGRRVDGEHTLLGRRVLVHDLGIFGCVDPLVVDHPDGRVEAARSTELLAYGRGNPMVFADPTGLSGGEQSGADGGDGAEDTDYVPGTAGDRMSAVGGLLSVLPGPAGSAAAGLELIGTVDAAAERATADREVRTRSYERQGVPTDIAELAARDETIRGFVRGDYGDVRGAIRDAAAANAADLATDVAVGAARGAAAAGSGGTGVSPATEEYSRRAGAAIAGATVPPPPAVVENFGTTWTRDDDGVYRSNEGVVWGDE